jgi:hypothetical protein
MMLTERFLLSVGRSKSSQSLFYALAAASEISHSVEESLSSVLKIVRQPRTLQ